MRCNDQFIIESGKPASDKSLKLRIIKTEQKFSGFCLNVNSDLTYSARVCRKSSSRLSKFAFYPYILIVSNVFLLATFVIYIMYGKTLLRHYTKLMLHLCGTLFTAFLVLAINQFYHFANHYITSCRIFGKKLVVSNIYQDRHLSFLGFYTNHRINEFYYFTGFILQYSFLSSFTFMTIMGVESWIQIHESKG